MATRYIQGNDKVQGSTDGVAPAAGYVGETKVVTQTVASEQIPGVSGTWYASGLSLVLEPGVWSINATSSARTYYSAFTNGDTLTYLAVCTGTTASPTVLAVANNGVPPRTSENLGTTLTCMTTVVVPTTTTYYLYYRRITTGTNTIATTGITGTANAPTKLEAIRIA